MDKKTKQKIFSKRELIKYSPQRAYFGKLTGAALATAFGQFKQSQDWEKPITSARVNVGKISGGVICHALWNEMSYNPARFGKVSPFMYNGKEDIYHFCRNGVPESFPGFEIIEKLRHKMIDFMVLNGRNKGCWYDNIDTESGYVVIRLINGHSDDNYKALSLLREMIRIVVTQNLEDFKHKAYRVQMLNVIDKRHPNGVRDEKAVVIPTVFPREMTPEEKEEDRLDRAEEQAQITAENRKYVSSAQYRQARSDLKEIADIKRQKTK